MLSRDHAEVLLENNGGQSWELWLLSSRLSLAGREVVEKRGCVGHTYPAESCVGQLE